jgi:hypothetical protein
MRVTKELERSLAAETAAADGEEGTDTINETS